MAAALQKIAEHISNAKKFRRASPLLRQLLQDGKVQGHHADLLFQVRSTRAPSAMQAAIWLRNYAHVPNSPKLGEACHVTLRHAQAGLLEALHLEWGWQARVVGSMLEAYVGNL